MNWRNSGTNNYSNNRYKSINLLKFFSPNSLLVTSIMVLTVSIIGTFIVNYFSHKRSFCIKEVKQFNVNEFIYRDISILLQECKPYVDEYKLFEDILYSEQAKGESIKNFSRIISRLYHNKKYLMSK